MNVASLYLVAVVPEAGRAAGLAGCETDGDGREYDWDGREYDWDGR